MLSIGTPRKGTSKKPSAPSSYYFRYYTDKEKQEGIWFGKGAELLGLESLPVRQSVFEKLIDGFSPDGRFPLVQNAGSPSRQRFWDLTLSPDKSVSLLCFLAPEKQSNEILLCVEKAAHKTLQTIEENFGLSRQGQAGKNVVPAALAFALFPHITSRAEDPQIHWHCVLPNVGVRPDGSTGALVSKPIYQAKIQMGQFFQETLARELSSRLGIQMEKGEVGYRVKEVPRGLCDVFSTRRKEVEAEVARTGKYSALRARAAAEKTRRKKKHTKEEVLKKRWRSVAADHGFTEEHAKLILEKGREKLEGERVRTTSRGEQHQQERGDNRQEETRSRSGRQEEQRTMSEPHQESQKRKSEGVKCASERESDGPSREEKERLKKFQQELREVTDRIFPERQTRERITRIAFAVAKKHGVDRDVVPRAVDNLHLPTQGRFVRVEWRRVFADAPKWNPLREWRTPRLVPTNQRRRWGAIRWDKPIPKVGESSKVVRIQERRLFSRAPEWSPLSKITVPALRLGAPRVRPKAKEHLSEEKERERSR